MTKKTPFKLKSGNKPAFKDVGSSPIMEEEKQKGEKGKKWKQALAKIGNAAVRGLTGGLDAVYGTGKVKSGGGVVFDEGKDNDSNSPEENVEELTS